MATHRKNLRTWHWIWEGRCAPSVRQETLATDITADVLVMGAGISGALIADALASEGVTVAVVDKRAPAPVVTQTVGLCMRRRVFRSLIVDCLRPSGGLTYVGMAGALRGA